MTGILGTGAVLITDINLIIQIVSFLILLISIVYKIKGKIKIHGYLVGLAVFLHFITFIVAMGPSFIDGREFFTTSTNVPGVQYMWIHAITGGAALILGTFLVIAWVIKISQLAGCYKRKRIMDITVLLWSVSVIFGILTYTSLYM